MSCKRFLGKNTIVTGGGRDIGAAIALRLGAEGANVVVNYSQSAKQAQEVAAALEAMGVKAPCIQADVSKAEGVAKLIEESVAALSGGIDVLVNNAGGIIERRNLMDMSNEFWDAIMDLNLKSTFMMCKAVKPHMKAGGAIVNVGSMAARMGGGPGAGAYATSKAGVLNLTRALAKELAPEGIRVNVVEPGLIDTKFHEATSPEVMAAMSKNVALGRLGVSEDVAGVVAFLASDDAAYVTGEALEINGGMAFV